MKNLLFLFAFLAFFTPNLLSGQTAEGGCTTVKVTSQMYDAALIESCYIVSVVSPCLKNITTPIVRGHATIVLQRQNADGSFSDVSSAVRSRAPEFNGLTFGEVTFNNLAHGTYRGRVRIPLQLIISCGSIVYNHLPSLNVGTQAVTSGNFFTNQVVVGATVQSDIAWSFIDPALNNGFYSPGQDIKMNTTGTKNYEAWWVAIFENGGQNRYWSNGWTAGQIPGNQLNLSVMCPFSSTFAQLPVSYTVQFAISNNCNTVWTNLDRTTGFCPGCRIAKEDEIALFPNPANNTFQLLNLDINPTNQQRVLLTDMSGRTVKSFEQITQSEFDISDLDNGLYVVNILEGESKVFTTKLSVVK